MKLSSFRFVPSVHAAGRRIESLETRILLSATLVEQVPSQTLNASLGAGPAMSLTPFFTDPTIPAGDTVVDIQTNLQGPDTDIPLMLTDSATPQTVANFLKYVNSGEYTDTIIHRSIPGFIVQGGGDNTDGSQINSFGTIPGESATETLHNTTGAIAMALSTGPDSAGSEWFFNLVNNDGTGETPDLDDTSDGGPFTAFGSVFYGGMDTLNAIAALPTVDATAVSGEWSNLPVQNYNGTSGASVPDIPATDDFVLINPVVVPAGLTYTAVSSNTGIVTASVSSDGLTLTPVGSAGTASITVTATDLAGGTATSTFPVTVTNPTILSASVGAGAAKAITYTDADGATGVITLKGPGAAAVDFRGTNLGQTAGKTGITITGTDQSILSINTTNTTAASVLTITTKGGSKVIDVGGLSTDSLKSLAAKGVIFTGDLTATGSIASLSIAGADGGTITAASLGTFTAAASFSDNLTLSSTGVALTNFTAAAVPGGTWTLAGSAKSINITKGDLDATIIAASIGTLKVRGNLSTASLNLSAAGSDLTALIVTGSISGSSITAAGNIGAVSTASMLNSEIFAGIGTLPALQALPQSTADFVTASSIKSVNLKTVTNAESFSNSDIAAAALGNLSLGTIQTSNGGDVTGVAAQTITTLTAASNKKFSLHKLTSATNVSALLTKAGADISPDFQISLF